MSLYYSLDSLLAKQNLFYDECREVAQTITDELIEADRHNEEDEDLEEYITDQLRDHVGDMMTAYAEDLMNSYGITKAMRQYIAEYDYDLKDDLFANSVVLVIMTKPVIGRVLGSLLDHRISLHRLSLQRSS